MKKTELEYFRIEGAHELYSVPICDILENGAIQLQIDKSEWPHESLRIELPGERIVNLITDDNLISKGELYAFWGGNDRLYLSGKGFSANQILMKRIGDRLLIKI